MNLLDYIIILTLLILIVRGILRGFVKEIASLVGIVLGFVLGTVFQDEALRLLQPYLPGTPFLPVISFASIFVVVLIGCNIIGSLIRLWVKKTFLNWLDRSLGAGFALVKGVIITYLAIVLLTFFSPSQMPLIADSALSPWIVRSYQSMASLISPNHYQKWRNKFLGNKPAWEPVKKRTRGGSNTHGSI